MSKFSILRVGMAVLAMMAVVGAAMRSAVAAEPWPARTVTVIVPTAAGGAPDIIARMLCERLSVELGQTFVVLNRPGANQVIGMTAAAKAPKDGYTLIFASTSGISMNRLTVANPGYDPAKDFTPIINVGLSPMMITVNSALPIKSVSELVAYAKAHPGQLNFGTIAQRNVPQVTGNLLNATAGIDMVHVGYPTSQLGVSDAIAGRIQVMIDGIPPLLAMVNDGRLRAIAVGTAERLPDMQQLPTVAETYPGFEINGWFAMMAPEGTPQAVIDTVNAKLQAILKEPAVIAKMRLNGTYPVGGTPQEMTTFIATDYARLERAVKAAKIERE